MITSVCILFLETSLICANIPSWVIEGIAAAESSSYFKNQKLVYVDRRIGTCGERGPWQVTERTFHTVFPTGSFKRLTYSPVYAEKCTRRLLLRLYLGPAACNWRVAVSMYNTGVCGYKRNPARGYRYYRLVLKKYRSMYEYQNSK